MRRQRLLVLAIGVLSGCHIVADQSGSARAASPSAVSRQDEQLLLGFEPAEIDALPAALKQKVIDTTDVEGRSCTELQMPYGRQTRK
jgi:hypothetical protein